MILLFVLGGFFLWGAIFWQIDTIEKPAYEVRDAYKFASYALLLLLICMAYKALM